MARAGAKAAGRGRLRSPAGEAGCGGYFLIDALAALALGGSLLMIALPNLAPTTSPARLHALMSRAVALLRDARSLAALQNAPALVVFDAEGRLLRSAAETIVLPVDIAMEVASGGICRSDGKRLEIRFFPDGTNCGASLRFARRGAIFRIRLNWLTGYAEIVKGD